MKKSNPSKVEYRDSQKLLMPKTQAEVELTKHIESGRALIAKANATYHSGQSGSIDRERKRWVSMGETLLKAIFDTPKFGQEFANMNQIHSAGLAFAGGGDIYEYCEAFVADTEEYITKLEAAKEQLRLFKEPGVDLNLEVDALARVRNICERFPKAARQLENRRSNREPIKIVDEYDVQYILKSFLFLAFSDVREEEYTPSCAGASARMDFLLKAEKIVLEVKMTRNGFSDGKVGDELAADIIRYKSHPDCETLVCFIYDPNHLLKNPTGLARDLSQNEGKPVVEVIIQH